MRTGAVRGGGLAHRAAAGGGKALVGAGQMVAVTMLATIATTTTRLTPRRIPGLTPLRRGAHRLGCTRLRCVCACCHNMNLSS